MRDETYACVRCGEQEGSQIWQLASIGCSFCIPLVPCLIVYSFSVVGWSGVCMASSRMCEWFADVSLSCRCCCFEAGSCYSSIVKCQSSLDSHDSSDDYAVVLCAIHISWYRMIM